MMRPSISSNCLLVTVLLLSLCATFSSCCFIRNCPLGGKRSGGISTIQAHRECLRCGPGGLGQCLGPNICCGQAIGCFLNTAESRVCEHENDIPTPCRIEGATCGQGQGKCAADGVCCTDQGCRLESTCDVKEQGMRVDNLLDYPSQEPADLTPDLLQYIKRLLAAKALGYRKK